MSKVTNVILTCGSSEKERDIISQIVNYSHNFSIGYVDGDKLPDKWYGGTKYLECNIFIGAYNHLNLPKFISFLRCMKWEDSEDVQLMVKEEDDSRFKLINVLNTEDTQLPDKESPLVRD